MHWRVELSDEVKAWYGTLGVTAKAQADRALDRLEERGSMLRPPYSQSLNGGLFELRFTCHDQAQRVTYYFDTERAAITLTTFVKNRKNERREVQRAHRAMQERKGRSR
jgi:hypothetical protein